MTEIGTSSNYNYKVGSNRDPSIKSMTPDLSKREQQRHLIPNDYRRTSMPVVVSSVINNTSNPLFSPVMEVLSEPISNSSISNNTTPTHNYFMANGHHHHVNHAHQNDFSSNLTTRNSRTTTTNSSDNGETTSSTSSSLPILTHHTQSPPMTTTSIIEDDLNDDESDDSDDEFDSQDTYTGSGMSSSASQSYVSEGGAPTELLISTETNDGLEINNKLKSHDYHHHHRRYHLTTSDSATSHRIKKRSFITRALTTSYKSRVESFRRSFRGTVADGEPLLTDYSCAYRKRNNGILLQGRMFLTEKWICFYAKILTEVKLVLPMKNIVDMSKERTAMLFPNAIQIITKCQENEKEEKYFFTTFTSRDRAYAMLHTVWENCQKNTELSPDEFWTIVHDYYGEDLGFSTSPEEAEESRKLSESMNTQRSLPVMSTTNHHQQTLSSNPAIATTTTIASTAAAVATATTTGGGGGGELILGNQEIMTPTMTGETAGDFYGLIEHADEFGCRGHNHLNEFHLNFVVNIPVDELWNLLFTVDGDFMKKFTKSENLHNVKATEWHNLPMPNETMTSTTPASASTAAAVAVDNNGEMEEEEDETIVDHFDELMQHLPDNARISHNRDLFMSWRQVEYNICHMLKHVYTHEYQRKLKSCIPGEQYTVLAKVVHIDNMCPADFYVEKMFCLIKVDENRSRLRVFSYINVPTNCNFIVKQLLGSAPKELKKHFNGLQKLLQSFIAEHYLPLSPVHIDHTNPGVMVEVNGIMTKSQTQNSIHSDSHTRRKRKKRQHQQHSHEGMVVDNVDGVRSRRIVGGGLTSGTNGGGNSIYNKDQNHNNKTSKSIFQKLISPGLDGSGIQPNTLIYLLVLVLGLCSVYYYLNCMVVESERLSDRFNVLLEKVESQHQQILPTKQAAQLNLGQLSSLTMKTTETWAHLLLQRKRLETADLRQWRLVLDHTIRVIQEMLSTLIQMRDTIDEWIASDTGPSSPPPPAAPSSDSSSPASSSSSTTSESTAPAPPISTAPTN